jgi:hypothetical protein
MEPLWLILWKWLPDSFPSSLTEASPRQSSWKENHMSIMFGARVESRRGALPRGSEERVSAPQVLRLAFLVVLAAFWIGLSTSPKAGQAGAQGAIRAFGLAAPHASR